MYLQPSYLFSRILEIFARNRYSCVRCLMLLTIQQKVLLVSAHPEKLFCPIQQSSYHSLFTYITKVIV